MSVFTGSHLCPRSLDCARAGRHFCQPGSSHCGPCLHPLVENSHGHCVVKRRQAPQSAQASKGKWLASYSWPIPLHLFWSFIYKTKTRVPYITNIQHNSYAHRTSVDLGPCLKWAITEKGGSNRTVIHVGRMNRSPHDCVFRTTISVQMKGGWKEVDLQF